MSGGARWLVLAVLCTSCDLSRVPYPDENGPPMRIDTGVAQPDASTAIDGAVTTDAAGDGGPIDARVPPDVGPADATPRDTGLGGDAEVGLDADAGVADAGAGGDGGEDTGVRDAAAPDASPGEDARPRRDAGPGSPLGATCTRSTDCASFVCFDLGGTAGRRCVSACGGDSDCGPGFTCYDDNGGKVCAPANAFAGGDFSRSEGDGCTLNLQCHSNFCASMRCNATCASDPACGGFGQRCVWRNTPGGSTDFVSACGAPTGMIEDRSSCAMSSQCKSGACVEGLCRPLCRSAASCRPEESCDIFDDSRCVTGIVGMCLAYEVNAVKVCRPRPTTGRLDPTGTPCTAGSTCLGGLCHLSTVNACTETCSSDEDCPLTHRCKLEVYDVLEDNSTIWANICVPERT